MNTAFVVKLPSGLYLADRIHHRAATSNIAQALIFQTEEKASAIKRVAPEMQVIQILIAEYEPE